MGDNIEDNRTFTKPYESSNGGDLSVQYTEYIAGFIEEENKNGFFAKYAVGITFGVDLAKWSDILNVIFHSENNGPKYNTVKDFKESALLITDSVYIKNHNTEIGDLQAENLNIWLWREKDYLHTKLILIRLEKEGDTKSKILLFVSSKNISNSNNCDLIITLKSKAPAEKSSSQSSSHGQRIWEYLSFLKKNCGGEDDELKVLEGLEDLKNADFEVDNTLVGNPDGNYEGTLEDLRISYNGNRFDDKFWGELCSCDKIISPYISEDQLKKINRSGYVRILTYYETYASLKELPDGLPNGIDFFVGNMKAEAGGGRYKFHAKFFMKKEGNKTVIYFGSANLTKEAKDNHCEILLKISFEKGNNKKNLYDHISEQFFTPGNNTWILKISEQIEDVQEAPDSDDEGGNISDYRTAVYTLAFNDKENKYKWYRTDKDNTKLTKELNSGEISHFIVPDGENSGNVYVCGSNYKNYKDDERPREDGWKWIDYDKFISLIKENKKKKIQDYYKNLLINPGKKRKSASDERNLKRGKKKGTVIIPQYPCLYRYLQMQGKTDVKAAVQELIDTRMDDSDDNEIIRLLTKF